jgi:plasmid maintenance system antidote protein VapI
MTTQTDLETRAARWLIAQDGPDFTEAQREELVAWLSQSDENCRAYVRLVRAWRWTVLLHRTESPLMYKRRNAPSTSSRQGRLDRRFGSLLRTHREKRGLSQADLAEKAGLRESEISRIESGERALTLTSTYVLSRALGVAPSRLIAQFEQAMLGKTPSGRKRKSK